MTEPADLQVGVDIGGTYTDLVAYAPSRDAVHVEKTPSTPPTLEDGVIDALEALFDDTAYVPGDVELFAHGSTATVNALIERRGAKTAILHTAGFDAIPVARRGDRPQERVFDPRYRDPDPFVPQRLVRGVPERVDADGNVVEPLDEDAAREVVDDLGAAGDESIAVCFLFSFLNPAHERRVRELIRERVPDCRVSLSSTVAPRIREFPRLSTTAIDGYVATTVPEYVTRLEARLELLGVVPATTVTMLSHGGVAPFETAVDRPVQTLLSGPAAGVQGAVAAVGESAGSDLVTMDMGGTSCDIAIVQDGEPETTTETEIDGHPVSVPMIDIHTIGAGGGTIARVEDGRLEVGPRSAGADPGPVCYGRGGTAVTVTDANAVLGRLAPEAPLAGDLALDVGAAEGAVADQLADPLGLPVAEAAAGVVDVVNAEMEKELSIALVRRGFDPRAFSLVPYGGAGPMHASAIAGHLALDRVVVPASPGVTSALGQLTGDRKRIYERSQVDPLGEAPVEAVFDELVDRAEDDVGTAGSGDVGVDRTLELRYAQELYTVTVPVQAGEGVDALRDRFDRLHRDLYGHTADKRLETMTYRVTARVATDAVPSSRFSDLPEPARDEAESRPVYFEGERRETPVYQRDALGPGERFAGPAIVEQLGTTVVVEPGASGTVDDHGNIVLTGGEP